MTAMNRNNVEEIKSRIPIEDLIGSYIKLDKAGKSYKARCPFHNEKTPSFWVSPDRGGYYCFGCNAKGDIFTFVEQFEGLDFRGALKVLADRAGVKLVHDEKADGERDRLYKVMELATQYFEQQFEKSKPAKEYLKNRGVSDETIKNFRIGFAPDGWRNLLTYLKSKGFNETVMEKVGLIKEREVRDSILDIGKTQNKHSDSLITNLQSPISNFYDRFRGRIMFPISDSSGRVIAFSGRILKSELGPNGVEPAKYLNSPDTPLFDKSLVLYGLDKAKSEIRRLNYTIFVEGQMDLVMSHQAGIKNTVASSGTAMTEETKSATGIISNLGLVRRLSPNIVIAFDSDNAGRKAALRASGIALSLGMDVKIADIVGGKDPADLVMEDVENWKNILRNSKPVIEFELDNVVGEFVNDPRKLNKTITEKVLPLVARIESSSDQSHFVAMIADKARLPIDSVWQDVKVVAKRLKEEEIKNNPIDNGFNNTGNSSGGSSISQARTTSEIPRRIDLIERRLFGLLFLIERESLEIRDLRLEIGESHKTNLKSRTQDNNSQDQKHELQITDDEIKKYFEQVKKMAGDSFELRMKRALEMKSDLLFEAESFFGNEKKEWNKSMKELLTNFELDIISEEIINTMHELKQAEKAGDQTKVVELAKKCQVLSIRKAEVRKKG